MQIAFTEHLHAIEEIEQRIGRLEKALIEEAAISSNAELIQLLQSLRGIGFLTNVTLAAEMGSFARFRSPAQLMATWAWFHGNIHRESVPNEVCSPKQEMDDCVAL